MKEIYRQIISGLAASICLAVFSYGTEESFGVNLLMAAFVGFATYILLPQEADPREIKLDFGVSQAQLNEALATIEAFIDAFNTLSQRSRDEWLREVINQVIIFLRNIRARFEKNPQDLYMPCTTLFMDQYLPRSHKLFTDYVRLWNHATERALRANLKHTETTAERVISGYAAFYRQCLLDGLVDLRAGNETMKTILDTDLASYGAAESAKEAPDRISAPAEPAGGGLARKEAPQDPSPSRTG